MGEIQIEAKTDRELLIQVAMTTNDISEKVDNLDHRMDSHAKRIRKLESGGCGFSMDRRQMVGVWTAISSIVAGALYFIVKVSGW